MVAKLAVVIHAEEEFDWSGGFKQHQDQVTHHLELITLIDGMIQAGAKVTLAMDYPFVTSDGGSRWSRIVSVTKSTILNLPPICTPGLRHRLMSNLIIRRGCECLVVPG